MGLQHLASVVALRHLHALKTTTPPLPHVVLSHWPQSAALGLGGPCQTRRAQIKRTRASSFAGRDKRLTCSPYGEVEAGMAMKYV